MITDLRTIAAILDELLTVFEPNWQAMTDPWLIGMEGGPPEPLFSVLANPQGVTCGRCTTILKSALQQLRRDYAYTRYRESIAALSMCPCKSKYEEHILAEQVAEGEIRLFERARRNIDFAASRKEEYLARLLKG